nr:MAG TPA: 60S ribosome biogenesis protein [Caudoviricetes sp.]
MKCFSLPASHNSLLSLISKVPPGFYIPSTK